MQRAKWIERKFNFDFPIGILPNILERLRGTAARAKEIVADLSNEEASYRPGDKWSVKEHLGHLADLEKLHEGRIDDFLAGKEILRAADMSNARTNEARHNEQSIQHLLRSFSETRVQLVSRLEALNDETHNLRALHPRLQVLMRPVDMAYFTAEHDDHHLASMREIWMHYKNNY